MNKLMCIEGTMTPNTLALGATPKEISLHPTINGNVAILPIQGPIVQDFDFFSFLFGGVLSMDLVSRELSQLKDDASIDIVILDVSSPGSEAAGIDGLSNQVTELAKVKTVVAVTNDIMASGAYWLSSGANKIFATSLNAMIGSVGARMQHIDASKALEMRGLKVTEIAKGKFKGMGGEHKPLSREDEDALTAHIDLVHKNFVEAVADNRGIPVAKMQSDVIESKLFLASEALEAGLIDGIDSLENIINVLQGGNTVDLTILKKDHPGVYGELFNIALAEGKKGMFTAEEVAAKIQAEKEVGVKAGLQAAVEVAIKTERHRIKSITELAVAGQDALVESMVNDGTDEKDAAGIILADLKKQKGAELELIRRETMEPMPGNTGENDEDGEAITKETFAKHKDLVKEFGQFEVYDAYIKSKV